jgi:AmiR/NasT family two-component response regulator
MSRYKILIVDDDPIIRMDLKEMLQEEGYVVAAEARNGDEAVELAYKHNPDLIIMDVKMPVMNGIKAADIIGKRHDAAVLLLTAYSQKELVRDARNAGVAAFLVKPVSEEDLLPAVAIALSQRDRMLHLKQNIASLQESLEERKLVEKAKGRLMSRHAMNEEEAYRWMRSRSMNSGHPLSKIAEELLRAEAGEGSAVPGGRA